MLRIKELRLRRPFLPFFLLRPLREQQERLLALLRVFHLRVLLREQQERGRERRLRVLLRGPLASVALLSSLIPLLRQAYGERGSTRSTPPHMGGL